MQAILKAITPTFEFCEIETKGEKQYFIDGYISTPDVDLMNDAVSENALKDMVVQCNKGTIMLDFEHDTIHEENLDKNPFGRVISAQLDSKGVRVKAELNSSNRRFKEIWSSIKGGFIRAFSIAFKALRTVTKYIQGKAIRILDQLELVNVALTGNPVNQYATFNEVIVKAMKEETEEKAKYIKRTGTSRNFKYFYREGKEKKYKRNEELENEIADLASSDMNGFDLRSAVEELSKTHSQDTEELLDMVTELRDEIGNEKERIAGRASRERSPEEEERLKKEHEAFQERERKRDRSDEGDGGAAFMSLPDFAQRGALEGLEFNNQRDSVSQKILNSDKGFEAEKFRATLDLEGEGEKLRKDAAKKIREMNLTAFNRFMKVEGLKLEKKSESIPTGDITTLPEVTSETFETNQGPLTVTSIKSQSTEQSEDKNKMAEETKSIPQTEVKAEAVKSDKAEIKSEVSTSIQSKDSSIELAELKSLKDENALLKVENEKLKQMNEVPVMKAIQESVPNQLNNKKLTPLDFI